MLQIVFLTIVSVIVFLPVVALAAQRLLYPKVAILEVVTYPLVSVVGQVISLFVDPRIHGFDCEARLPARISGRPSDGTGREIGQPICWPAWRCRSRCKGSRTFSPSRKKCQWTVSSGRRAKPGQLSLFGVTFAPLLEELFFRGFLYPVLVRRFGMAIAVLTTAAGFSLIHAPQLGRAWGPVLVIFMVGLALTITRAVTKSVAASLIMHMAYNGTLSVLLFVGTDGFRHLERLNQ